jgi:hypothetical protein
VLYDPADGRIVHIHMVVAFDGALPADRKPLEAEARSILASQKHRRSGLKALHVASDTLKPGVSYRVDHARGKLAPRPEK